MGEIFLGRHLSNGDDEDIDSKAASVFIKNMRELDVKGDHILIHLSAGGGGEWESGMAIYDSILTAQSFISLIVYGHACSMSSLIVQAADMRYMMPNSYMMIHYGTESFANTLPNNTNYFALSKKLKEDMINIYAGQMKSEYGLGDENKARALIKRKLDKGDWYLRPDECKQYNLIDAIVGDDGSKNIRQIYGK